MKSVILISLILALCYLGAADYIYAVEYQYGLFDSDFSNGRDEGIEYMFSSWSSVTGVEFENMTRVRTIRQEGSTELDDCGGKSSKIRRRTYLDGDWKGLETIGIKTVGPLDTMEDAIDEPFAPADEYSDICEEYIEYDQFPCYGDYAANSRLYFYSSQEIATCEDVDNYFPNAVKRSNDALTVVPSGLFTYVEYRNGYYKNGMNVSLAITIDYNSLEDAQEDINRSVNEFSYTTLSMDELTEESLKDEKEVFSDLLDIIGSTTEDDCESSYLSSNQSSGGVSIVGQLALPLFSLLLLVL